MGNRYNAPITNNRSTMGIETILIIVLVVIVIFIISKYNGIIQMRNNRQNAFADIDVQLQQRFDLVPNLVSTVK